MLLLFINLLTQGLPSSRHDQKPFNIDGLWYQVHALLSVAHIKVLYIKWPQEEALVSRQGITFD